MLQNCNTWYTVYFLDVTGKQIICSSFTVDRNPRADHRLGQLCFGWGAIAETLVEWPALRTLESQRAASSGKWSPMHSNSILFTSRAATSPDLHYLHNFPFHAGILYGMNALCDARYVVSFQRHETLRRALKKTVFSFRSYHASFDCTARSSAPSNIYQLFKKMHEEFRLHG